MPATDNIWYHTPAAVGLLLMYKTPQQEHSQGPRRIMDLRSHPQPDNLTATHPMALIPGWCAMKEEPTVPHTHCGGLLFPPRNLTRSQHRRSPRQNTDVCSHLKAQPRTPTMTTTVFSPTTKPHLPKEYIDKAQGDIWAHAQPHKNSMLDYLQYNDATHLPKYGVYDNAKRAAPAALLVLSSVFFSLLLSYYLGTSTARYPTRHPDPESARQRTRCRTTPAAAGVVSLRCMKPHPTRTQPRSKTKNGHAQPPATQSKNPTPEHNNGGNMVPHTRCSRCVVIPGPSPQTPATGETTGKAPSPLQKIMPETGWVTV
ncbi:hypothetical protein BS47DRAFT_1368155 [Hydnum rufescens UP504]|uniref:Uncharacterized protein n=1 Tax=Hydnum rufescens UP504 TaxID=1448309 RepID=A0A9P6AGA1_9AGAM|nr:hypothetical protein BS47DRAFT_1368155 [Hydnum rufescens UP504]